MKTEKFILKIFLLFKKSLLSLCFLTIPLLLSGQKSDILYSNFLGMTKTIQVELSDSAGNLNIINQVFNQYDKIYFHIKSSGGSTWNFNSKDLEGKIKELKLVQNTKSISISKVIPLGAGSEYIAVVIGFLKSEVDITKPFTIRNKDYESQSLLIPEKLWLNYPVYTDLISKSKNAVVNQNYPEAFRLLTRLWSKSNFSPYLSVFSFYKSTKDSLNSIADQVLAKNTLMLKKEVDAFSANISESGFTSLNNKFVELQKCINSIDSFYVDSAPYFEPTVKATEVSSFKQLIAKEKTNASDLYQKKMLSILEDRNYQDYQFSIYTEMLFKLLTTVDKIAYVSGIDSIPISQMKNYKVLGKELLEMGWEKNFISLCQVINKNIKDKKSLFNETALANYTKNIIQEPQPYSILCKAFNSLTNKDKTTFCDLVNQSLGKITDKELLSNLDLLISLMNSKNQNSNEAFWTLLNTGYNAQINGSLQDAKANYEKAEKIFNNSEILYYLLASVNLKLGDRFSAEIYFKRVNSMNQKFISSKIYQIEFLMEDKDYESALAAVNEALTVNPIWYYYFKKAQLLTVTGKFEEAKQIVQTNCIAINSLNYEQYLLLGDIYFALSDTKTARENYMKAGSIKPNNLDYKKKMELLVVKKTETSAKPADTPAKQIPATNSK